MTNQRQWTLVAGLAMAGVFAVALAIRIRPELNLVGVGSNAPNFSAVNLRTARPASLGDYQGKVLLINIWATWCQPCRVEMPALEQLSRRFKGTGFTVVAVSIDKDDSTVVNAFVRELGLTFDILHDKTGDIQRIYQTTGVPESFVVDRDGAIVKKVIGAAEWDSPVNEALVQRLLDEH
ncbi:MAG TPA: TlpA disulfide reductase family protein [Gemmatimonadales bacterium]|nr:TlpA disulfide reductase family protein [Gemmatimonadales bacterium]